MHIRNYINESIVKRFPWMGRWVYKCGMMYRKICMRECKKSYGEKNADKVFYVIRQLPPGQGGLLCNYVYTICLMQYAYEKGWIPVVDMENYKVLYSQDDLIYGTHNAWEYFFTQPEVSLEEVYQSRNVILSAGTPDLTGFHSFDENLLKKRCELAQRIPLNLHVRQFIDVYGKEVFNQVKDDRVLGVYYRGTTYKLLKDHPNPATDDEYEALIREKMIAWNCSKIFIVSDEWDFIDKMKHIFPNALYIDHPRVKGFDSKKAKSIREEIPEGSNGIIENLLFYLTDVYIYSHCTSILGGMNNGVYTSILWNNGKYENIQIMS